jgi:hypothetical protein
MNCVKETPPDIIHKKSTQLEETKARNLRVSKKGHSENSLESQIQGTEDYQAFIFELDGQLMVVLRMSED